MKIYLLIPLLLLYLFTSAQYNDSTLSKKEFLNEVSKLTSRIRAIDKHQLELRQTITFQNKKADSFERHLFVTDANIKQIADSLHIAVSNVSSTNDLTKKSLATLAKQFLREAYIG